MTRPCLGYPSQARAIEALHLQGKAPIAIAAEVGASRAVVDTTISKYRKRKGEPPKRVCQGNGSLWELPPEERRRAIMYRAAKGARMALEAAQ